MLKVSYLMSTVNNDYQIIPPSELTENKSLPFHLNERRSKELKRIAAEDAVSRVLQHGSIAPRKFNRYITYCNEGGTSVCRETHLLIAKCEKLGFWIGYTDYDSGSFYAVNQEQDINERVDIIEDFQSNANFPAPFFVPEDVAKKVIVDFLSRVDTEIAGPPPQASWISYENIVWENEYQDGYDREEDNYITLPDDFVSKLI